MNLISYYKYYRALPGGHARSRVEESCFIKCVLYQMHALSNVCFTKCVWAAKEHIWSRFGASKIQSNIGKCSLLECYNDLHNGFLIVPILKQIDQLSK